MVAVAVLLGLFSKRAVSARSLMPLAALYGVFITVIAVM
jgi:hypothetical protein